MVLLTQSWRSPLTCQQLDLTKCIPSPYLVVIGCVSMNWGLAWVSDKKTWICHLKLVNRKIPEAYYIRSACKWVVPIIAKTKPDKKQQTCAFTKWYYVTVILHFQTTRSLPLNLGPLNGCVCCSSSLGISPWILLPWSQYATGQTTRRPQWWWCLQSNMLMCFHNRGYSITHICIGCIESKSFNCIIFFWRDHQHFKLRRFGWIHLKIKITNAKSKVIWGYSTHFDTTWKPPVPQPQTLWQWTSLIYQESCAAHRLRGQERSADGQVSQTKGKGWKMMIGSTKTSESRYIPRNIH